MYFQFQYRKYEAAAMVTLRLVFILVIIQRNLVLSKKLLQDSSDKYVKEKHDLSHRLFKRQVSCKEGEYFASEFCCKFCHKGTHATSDCTEPQGEPVCKECTEGVDFMDKENGYAECQRCRNCDKGAGQEQLHPCTITQNTVCKCIEGFFCSDENCNRCQKCKPCDHEIAEECTSTKDTVCKDFSNRTHAILWPVIVVFFIVAIIIFVVLRYRKKKWKTEIPEPSVPLIPIPPKPTCPPLLESIDLDSQLFEISGQMGQESVRKLVEKQLTPVDLEDIKKNNPYNAREEKCELLKKWYNHHGRQGAFKMLIQNCTNLEAEKIIDLVQKENAEP
ncbi:tumor necrosis factor receptor superfamily member 6 isoform X2 [Lithobates pipiens]